jgi:hypothetical protein
MTPEEEIAELRAENVRLREPVGAELLTRLV